MPSSTSGTEMPPLWEVLFWEPLFWVSPFWEVLSEPEAGVLSGPGVGVLSEPGVGVLSGPGAGIPSVGELLSEPEGAALSEAGVPAEPDAGWLDASEYAVALSPSGDGSGADGVSPSTTEALFTLDFRFSALSATALDGSRPKSILTQSANDNSRFQPCFFLMIVPPFLPGSLRLEERPPVHAFGWDTAAATVLFV